MVREGKESIKEWKVEERKEKGESGSERATYLV